MISRRGITVVSHVSRRLQLVCECECVGEAEIRIFPPPPPAIYQPPSFFDSHDTVFEIAPEARRLVALHLPVLDRAATQVFIQLGSIYRRCTLLIHRGGPSYPEVDVSRLV